MRPTIRRLLLFLMARIATIANLMRKAFTSCVVLLLCAGLFAPAAVANLHLAMMSSHQGCARATVGQPQHHHCSGMPMETEAGSSAQISTSSHDCCQDCCLGLAFSNGAKARPATQVSWILAANSKPLSGETETVVPRIADLGERASRAPPALSVL